MATATLRSTSTRRGFVARLRSLLARIRPGMLLALAFILPPLLVGGAGAARAFVGPRAEAPPPLNQALPARPAHDPSRPTAVIVAGNAGTESSDLMGPYETLTTSGRFNVYVAAPERTLSPLFPGDLALVPHYSFAEYDAELGGAVDLLVIPYIPNAETADAPVLTWIQAKAASGTTMLSICAGALAVADSGVLAGQTATTHHFSMLVAERTHPEINWVRGQRYVDSGQFISAAGVTSGIDATLYTLGRMFGRETAEQTAQAMGYPHTRFLDDPTSNVGLRGDGAVWPSFFAWDRSDVGLVLYDGVRELEVASVIDTYPRSLAATVRTLAPERTAIRSRHGLDLVPRKDFATAPALDRVLVPGDSMAPESITAVQTWAAQRGSLTVEQIHADGGFLYDATLRDLARSQGNGVASAAANVIEYPTRDLALAGPAVRLDLVLGPLALGLFGLGAALWLSGRPAVVSRIGRGLRFGLHFAEMSLAMVAGMAVFHLLTGTGHGSAAESTSVAQQVWLQVGMMVFMTVPMVAWMQFRGHSLRHGAEMAIGMLAPTVVIYLLLGLGLGTALPWLQHFDGPAMLLGMLAAMLLRREHYTHGAHRPVPAAA
jgi:transcriptional regulator GlxA family with amidase domain